MIRQLLAWLSSWRKTALPDYTLDYRLFVYQERVKFQKALSLGVPTNLPAEPDLVTMYIALREKSPFQDDEYFIYSERFLRRHKRA